MEPVIVVHNLNFDKLTDFNLQIKKGTFLTILGSNYSGILSLTNLLCGITNNKNISINDNCKVLGIFSQEETPFITNKVIDELKISSAKLNECALEKVDSIIELFKMKSMINKKINKLNVSEKQILSIATTILMNPDVIIVDNCISNIDPFYRNIVLDGLKFINKHSKITIVNITTDSEQALFGNEIAIINNGKLIICNKKMKVIKDENLFLKNGLKVPFMVDLSIKLKYYGLVENIMLKKEKLVDEIWN